MPPPSNVFHDMMLTLCTHLPQLPTRPSPISSLGGTGQRKAPRDRVTRSLPSGTSEASGASNLKNLPPSGCSLYICMCIYIYIWGGFSNTWTWSLWGPCFFFLSISLYLSIYLSISVCVLQENTKSILEFLLALPTCIRFSSRACGPRNPPKSSARASWKILGDLVTR